MSVLYARFWSKTFVGVLELGEYDWFLMSRKKVNGLTTGGKIT
jgi:hypothetical protein